MLLAMTAFAVQHAKAQLGGDDWVGGYTQLSEDDCVSLQALSEIDALIDPIMSEGDGWETTDNCWHQVVFGSNYWIELEKTDDEDVKKFVKIYYPLPFTGLPAYVECQSEEDAHPSFDCE